MIGQIHHIRGNFPDAIKNYALVAGKGILYNDILLAQCYTHPSAQNFI